MQMYVPLLLLLLGTWWMLDGCVYLYKNTQCRLREDESKNGRAPWFKKKSKKFQRIGNPGRRGSKLVVVAGEGAQVYVYVL